MLDNVFDDALLEVGSGDPLGDDPVYYSGYIGHNEFRGESFFGVQGAPSRVFREALTFQNNRNEDGSCMHEFRHKSCYPTPHSTAFGCYQPPQSVPVDDACTAWRTTQTSIPRGTADTLAPAMRPL